jgi:hypothetical protein
MVFEPNTCLKKASNSSGYFCGFRVNVILTEGVAPVKVSFMCIAISATKKKNFLLDTIQPRTTFTFVSSFSSQLFQEHYLSIIIKKLCLIAKNKAKIKS